jgi:hypothetical protein
MNRAYSVITITKAVDDTDSKRRQFSGVATSPAPDRVSDTIDPLGAKFTNPLVLLRNHDSDCPIGKVAFKRPTAKGIEFDAEIPVIAEPGLLKDRLDMAWAEIRSGIINSVSIGFRPLKYAFKEDGGIEFQEIEIFELSTCAVPCQAEAIITQVKSFDRELRQAAGVPEPTLPQNPNEPKQPAASGQKQFAVVRLTPPGVTGKTQPTTTPKEGSNVKISEKIARFEEKRAANAARIAAIHESTDESLDEQQIEEVKNLEAQIATIDRDLPSLKAAEATLASTAKPVVRTVETENGDRVTATLGVSVKQTPKLEPGIGYARLVKVKMAARLDGDTALNVARKMYGPDSEVVGIIMKANEVVAGTTLSGNWAADLVSAEGAAVAAFLEYLRPATILGKFGVGGVPGLTRLDFYSPYVTQTGGGDAYWVGEGKPKPLTAFDFDRATLTPLKIANIAVLTEENIRYSSPNSDMIVRNALVQAIAAGLDVAFIDPANSGSANVKPASVTNGAEAIVSPGTGDADDVRLAVRALMQKFIDANNAPTNGVWVMSASNALALSLMVNALGQPEFSGISMTGGIFMGLPVIVSQHIGSVVALVAADQIFLGDEGGVAVDMSREASLEMRSTGLGMDAGAGTATAASVSMFQTNSVALRAERTINWKRARNSAVAYLTGAAWGGAVPAS